MKKLLSEYPELIKEWHPTKNGNSRPEDFTHGSGKKVWWFCFKEHSYDEVIYLRSRKENSTGCPYCSGRRVCDDNNLKFLFPEVAAEWHPTKNGDLKPEDFTKASNKKVWWLCPKGHSYDSTIGNRTSKNARGCPYCSGKRVCDDNNLKFLFPKVATEWDPTKNGDLKPEQFTAGSGQKVWWLCPKGHSHFARIAHRTRRQNPTGCSYCSGKKVSVDNNLKFLYPKLSTEWDPTKNGNLKPENFTKASNKKVWWLCPKGHSYFSSITHRTRRQNPTGCPYCSGIKVGEDNNLKFLFPEVSAEWHPTKNGDLKPEQFTAGSGKKVWWLCVKGHSYKTRIADRTTKKKQSGCPSCTNQSSTSEYRILSELRFLFNDVKSRHKIDGVEIDLFLPSLNLGIEYDSNYFHQGKEQKDFEKNEFLKLRGIKIIRVREKPLLKITENDLIVKNKNLSKSDLNKIFKKIHFFCDIGVKQKIEKYLDSESFINETLFREYLSYFPSPLPEHSLSKNHPNLISEWNFNKNHPLTPDNFSSGSDKKVWWLCPKGHSYFATIAHRTRSHNPTGCSYCSGKKVCEDNNLKFLFPEVAAEWHPTKNGDLKPEDFTKASNKKVWWLCPKGHSYDAEIPKRTQKKPRGCPYCSGKRVSEENNLKFLFPEVAVEWHPTKNGDLKPENFTYASNKKVWWLCVKGHSYKIIIAQRTKKKPSGCPHCYRNVS